MLSKHRNAKLQNSIIWHFLNLLDKTKPSWYINYINKKFEDT